MVDLVATGFRGLHHEAQCGGLQHFERGSVNDIAKLAIGAELFIERAADNLPQQAEYGAFLKAGVIALYIEGIAGVRMVYLQR